MVELCRRAAGWDCRFDDKAGKDAASVFAELRIDTVVYSPPLAGDRMPDLAEARNIFHLCARTQNITKLILLSNASIYGPNPQDPDLSSEARALPRKGQSEIGEQWFELERAASNILHGTTITLVVLRVAPVMCPEGKDYFNRLFQRRIAVTLPGHGPSIQLLDAQDLATAVRCAVERGLQGVYNVAPDVVIPLRAALRLSASKRLPIPRTLQRWARGLLGPCRFSQSIDQLDYIRYSWTVSNQKIKSQLGFKPKFSSGQALASVVTSANHGQFSEASKRAYDDFGLDREYVRVLGRLLFNFLERYYWRVEGKKLANLPPEGGVVIIGLHLGFMPV